MRWSPPPAPLPAAAAAPTAAWFAVPAAPAQAGPVPSRSSRDAPPGTDARRAPPRAPAAGPTVAPVGVHDAPITAAPRPQTPLTRLVGYLLTAHRRRLLRDLRRNAEWAAQARAAPTLQSWMDSHSR